MATLAGRREWIGLAVLTLPTLLVSVDVFGMTLALPTLSAQLRAGSTQQLWILDMYPFMLSGFLITMGTVGDLVGRRKLLLVGASCFGVASIMCAYAASPGELILARAILGIAGATLAPSTLALISNMFSDAGQRGIAITVWLMAFMGGGAAGPIVGGLMLGSFWWGSVFLLAVPIMVLLLVLGPILLPEYRDTTGRKLDLVSVTQSLGAVLPITYGIKELARTGWHLPPLLPLAAGLLVGLVFVRRQRRLADPLLDLRLFADRAFSTVLVSMLFGTMLTGAIMLYITQYLQLVVGLTPLRAGLWMLPATVATGGGFMLATVLVRWVRPAYLIGAGLVSAVFGLLLLTQVGEHGQLTKLVIGFVCINLGSGPLLTLGTDLIVGSVPPAKAGAAAAMNEASGEFGFALGIALMGSIGTAVYRRQIDANLPAGLPGFAGRAARDTLASASLAADRLPAQLGSQLLSPARAAYTSGMNVVAAISAAILTCVAVLTVRLLHHVPAHGAGTPAGEAEHLELPRQGTRGKDDSAGIGLASIHRADRDVS